MNQLQEAVTKTLSSLNPFSLDLTDAKSIANYSLRLVLLAAIIALLTYTVKNYRRIANFVKSTFLELKKINWLSKRKTYEYSLLTVGMIFFFTLFILLADQTFLFLRNLLIFPSI